MPTSLIFTALRAWCLIFVMAAGPVAPMGFTVTSVSNRILTPNGDGRNDNVVVQFENPQFSEVTGRVFDMKGHLVSAMEAVSSAPNTTLRWNGRGDAGVVAAGVYIYVIESEGRLYKGAVLVVK
jgi:hypothetical protein